MTKPTAISLFTGAGGLDYGFEAAGFRTAVAVEIDRRCCETLRANGRGWTVIDEDIGPLPTSRLLSAAGLAVGEADMLIGGPPCQPFSKSGFWATGEARRLADPRATTLEAYMRVLAEARPRAFLLENVEGLGFRGKDEGLQLIHRRLADINAASGTNYSASIMTLNAADFGVPQQRRRVFVVGARDGGEFRAPEPTHVDPAIASQGDPRPSWRTAWDALHALDNAGGPELAVKGKWAELLPSIPEGENYLWHTDRGGGEPLFGWRRRFWSFLLKLAKDQPAWTLQAQPGPATGPFHWRSRRLSADEMARLQTFPLDVEIVGSLNDAQRQLGNAVPSLLAEVIARSVRRQLLHEQVSERCELALGAAPPPRPPEPVLAVPSAFMALRGAHSAHPGTGRGYRASGRGSAVALQAAE